MQISIVGSGYVGLVTGACLAAKGHQVTCVDKDSHRVAALNAARVPIYEAGLDDLVRDTVGRTLTATTDLPAAIRDSEMTFIAVGTPFDGGAIDLTAVVGVSRQIGEVLRHKSEYHVVVVKSTVVPGTTDGIVRSTLEAASGKKAGVDFGLGMNPEFLSEGEAVHDFMFPDRIVLGGLDDRTIDVLDAVYRPFPDAPRIRTNTRTAEMIKYASNALLANLISFSNELANLGSAIGGIDAADVMRGLHVSQYFTTSGDEGLPRITSFLRPGCGFGGSCLPKDVRALIAHGEHAGVEMALLKAVIRVNEEQPGRVLELLRKHWADLRGVRVVVLGLSFKPGTADVRESPAFPIIRALLAAGAVVTAYDPVATEEARAVLPDSDVRYSDSLLAALQDGEAVVVVTPWEEFQQVPGVLRERLSPPLLVDCRGVFDRASLPKYERIGL
jgi:UDPglucose 6-dehydrogenase